MLEAALARPTSAVDGATYLMTRIDRFNVAFPVAYITSAHEAPIVYPLPLAQAGILGAVNVHGTAVPISDLRRSLRLNARAVDLKSRLLIIDDGGSPVGVVVDEVCSLFELDGSQMSDLAAFFGAETINERVIAGIACAPQPCALIDISGLMVPDHWDEASAPTGTKAEVDAHPDLAVRSAELAAPIQAASEAEIEVAAFLIAGQRYGVALKHIVEFFTQSAHVPLSFGFAARASLVNRRGEALALFNLRPTLGLEMTTLPELVDGLVLEANGLKIAIAVDSLDGLRTLATGAPAEVNRPGDYGLSLHFADGGTIVLLDVVAMMTAPALLAVGVQT